MEASARTVLGTLLTSLELPLEAIDHNVRLVGRDPVVPSRYRVGLASATALAAQAVGIIEIWKQRGGRDQTVTIDLRRAAVPGLRTISHTTRGGRKLQVPWPASERQVFFPTRDGRLIYLMRHAVYYEHLSKLLAFLDCAPESAAISRAVARWDSAELEEALAANKLMGTIVRSFDEWCACPQGRHLEGRLPIEIERIGSCDPVPFAPAGPCGPVSPCGPCEPWSPFGPCGPATPIGPRGPCRPTSPCGPCGPIAPVRPIGPCAPVAPCCASVLHAVVFWSGVCVLGPFAVIAM